MTAFETADKWRLAGQDAFGKQYRVSKIAIWGEKYNDGSESIHYF